MHGDIEGAVLRVTEGVWRVMEDNKVGDVGDCEGGCWDGQW